MIQSPQDDLPRGFGGGSDWDDGAAGVILSGEFFAAETGGGTLTQVSSDSAGDYAVMGAVAADLSGSHAILAGVAAASEGGFALAALFAMAILLATAPLAAHAMARAAHRSDLPPVTGPLGDALAGAEEEALAEADPRAPPPKPGAPGGM